MKLFILLFFFNLALFGSLPGQTNWRHEFSKEERKWIRKCKTGKLHIHKMPFVKEYIRFMNLARTSPFLLSKYVEIRYGKEYSRKIRGLARAKEERNKTCLLRPSLLLHPAAGIHEIGRASCRERV